MPRNLPFITTLEPGTYYWCSCGKTGNEPFCDGAHKETGKEPVAFDIASGEKVALCTCRRTKNPPYCDGTHAK
jgi:CDGSH iron-sulfur domain-containing protein 3